MLTGRLPLQAHAKVRQLCGHQVEQKQVVCTIDRGFASTHVRKYLVHSHHNERSRRRCRGCHCHGCRRSRGPGPVEGLELETDRPEVASPSAVACKDEGPAVLVSEGADEVVAGTVVDAVEGT